MDSRVTWGASGDNDAATAVCVAVCCCSVSVGSCVVATPVLLQRPTRLISNHAFFCLLVWLLLLIGGICYVTHDCPVVHMK